MSSPPPSPRSTNQLARALVRVGRVVVTPKSVFHEALEAPQASGPDLWLTAAAFGLLPPLCRAGGVWLQRWSTLKPQFRGSPIPLLGEALIGYGLILISVLAFAFLILVMARPFAGSRRFSEALFVSVYSSVGGWLGGLFYLWPPLQGFSVLGVLYGLYLFYVGAEIIVRPTRGPLLSFVILVLACYIGFEMLLIALVNLAASFA